MERERDKKLNQVQGQVKENFVISSNYVTVCRRPHSKKVD